LTARPLAHQNGQAPLLGAVAAGARLRGLTGEQMSLALRVGAILVLTPGYTNAVAGATALNVAGGMSGFAGALAPELALAGVAAQPDAIEEAFGQLVGDGFRPEAVTEELGQRWEIARNYFRLRACCNPIYSALDALEDILGEARPDPAAIERIDVATYRFAANMREPNPANYFAAKYSLPTRRPRSSFAATRAITPSPTRRFAIRRSPRSGDASRCAKIPSSAPPCPGSSPRA
jgi:2-methylcitrate dehydratase PrpD